MANSPSLTWIDISDFRPGIAQQSGIAYPLGQATDEHTYRCKANDSGSLVPLPRRNPVLQGEDYNSGTPSTGAYYIVGFYATGPLLPHSDTASSDFTESFVAVEYVHEGTRRFFTTLYKNYIEPREHVNLVDITSPEVNANLPVRGIAFGTTRDFYDNPTYPGLPIVVWHWYAGGGGHVDKTWTYPDSGNPATDSVYEIKAQGEDPTVGLIVCHQNRVVMFMQTMYPHGADGSWTTNEDLLWTAVNDVSTIVQADAGPPSVFVAESPTGYSVAMPMAANELFLVKGYGGGGLFVIGDLDNPTIQNLPQIPSTGVDALIGAYTDRGVVYSSRHAGALLWAGGSSVENIAKNLNPDFWYIPGPFIQVNSSWATWGDYVVGPNNWLYDFDQESWWRLEDPNIARFRWMRQTIGQPWRLQAAVSSYTSPSDTIVHSWSEMDTEKANNYSWQSHPIPSTIDREVEVQEVMASLSGDGDVYVTVSGRAEANVNPQTVTFTIDSDYPRRYRLPVRIQGSFIQIRIEATGTGTGNAPTVHQIQLGVIESNIVGRNRP